MQLPEGSIWNSVKMCSIPFPSPCSSLFSLFIFFPHIYFVSYHLELPQTYPASFELVAIPLPFLLVYISFLFMSLSQEALANPHPWFYPALELRRNQANLGCYGHKLHIPLNPYIALGDGGAYSSSSVHQHLVLTFTSDFLQFTKDSLPTHLAP